jgi:DNA-directed RNA polymerase I, II, and III subunit RPABC3
MQLLLDVNTDIYPVELGDKLTVALAKSLTDNEMDDGIFDQSGRASLADEYEYVMYGKVFKCLEDKGSKVYALRRACAVCAVCVVCVVRPTARALRVVKWTRSTFVSFGGLLMMLKGDAAQLEKITVDHRIYLLMRKA